MKIGAAVAEAGAEESETQKEENAADETAREAEAGSERGEEKQDGFPSGEKAEYTIYPEEIAYANFDVSGAPARLEGESVENSAWFEWAYVALYSLEYLKSRRGRDENRYRGRAARRRNRLDGSAFCPIFAPGCDQRGGLAKSFIFKPPAARHRKRRERRRTRCARL